MSDETRYVDIETFLMIARKSESTIYHRRKEIPGLSYEDGTYTILEGTRYPCDLHRYKIEDSGDRRYVLLKTISANQYICAQDLGLYQKQFENLLEDLLAGGLIRCNGMSNHYGANAYDCTPRGDEVLESNKGQAKKEITELIGIVSGSFIGSVISQVVE